MTPFVLVALVLLAFLCGSLPFSVWIGRLFLHEDIRTYGDGNPGAANAFRTGNKLVGVISLLLDISKAAFPVGLAYFTLGVRGLPMFLVATAPLLGHVFSPFLGFKGGKGIATLFGAWIGLTLWQASLPAVIGAVLGIVFFTPPVWSVLLGMAGILLVLAAWLPEPLFLAVWVAQVILMAWTHRNDLQKGIHFRPWISTFITRLKG